MFIVGVRIAVTLGILLGGLYYYIRNREKEEQENRIHTRNAPYGWPNCTSCVICLEEFVSSPRKPVIALPCGHKFHEECILGAFQNEIRNQRHCPVCRQQISPHFL